MGGLDQDWSSNKSSFASLYDSLLNAQPEALDSLEVSLQSLLPRLQNCGQPFKPRKGASIGKKVDGSPSDHEQKVVDKLSEIFDVDFSDMWTVLGSYRRDRFATPDLPDPSNLETSDFIDSFASFYFNERLVALSIVRVLFNAYTDSTSVLHPLSQSVVPSILQVPSDTKKGTTFFRNILSAYVELTMRRLPPLIRSQPRLSEFSSKQQLREQSSILNLLLLSFYADLIHPYSDRVALSISVLEAIRDTEWGEKQANGDVFDRNIASLTIGIQEVLVILSIEILSIDYPPNYSPDSFRFPVPSSPIPSETELLNPNTLNTVHSLVVSLSSSHPHYSKPLVIAWSYILKNITEDLLDSTYVRSEYLEFSQKLVKFNSPPTTFEGSSELLRNKVIGHTTWQEAFINCLEGSHTIFTSLSSLSSATILSQSSSDTLIYLSSMRLIFALLCRLVHPAHYMPPASDALLNAFRQIYSRPDATPLRLEFFPPPDSNTTSIKPDFRLGQEHFLNTVISRFPLRSEPTLLVLATLSSSSSKSPVYRESDDPNEQLEISDLTTRIVQSLDNLSELTLLTLGTYVLDRSGGELMAVLDIPVTKSVSIPKGSSGILVADPDQGASRMVIRWDLTKPEASENNIFSDEVVSQGWSAWWFLADIFEEGISKHGRRDKKQAQDSLEDVFGSTTNPDSNISYQWQSNKQREFTIAYAFQLLRAITAQDGAVASFVIERMADAPQFNANAEDIIRNLFRVFEKAMMQRSDPYSRFDDTNGDEGTSNALDIIVENGLHIFASLVPTYTGAIWTLLKAFPAIFTSSVYDAMQVEGVGSNPILATDKVEGKYSALLSLLHLIQQVLYEARRTRLSDSEELRDIKDSVVSDAIAWVIQDVWASFESWRYVDITDRYEIGQRCCILFTTIVDDIARQFAYPSMNTNNNSSSDSVKNLIIKTFLSENSSSAFARPLISSITANGFDSFENILLEGREDVYKHAETSVGAALKFLNSLLVCKRSVNLSQSMFPEVLTVEKLLFSQSTPESTNMWLGKQNSFSEPLVTLTNAVTNSDIDKNLSIDAIYILVQLSTLSYASKTQETTSSTSLSHHHQLQQAYQTPVATAHVPAFSIITNLGGPLQTRVFLSQLMSDLTEANGIERATMWKVGVWDLLSSWVDSQPALAIAFLRDVHSAGDNDSQKGGLSVHEFEDGSFETAISVATKHLRNARNRPSESVEYALLDQSVVRFLHFTWQHLAEYAVELKSIRSNSQFWDDIGAVIQAFESHKLEENDEDEVMSVVMTCAKSMSAYHAFLVISLDLQLESYSREMEAVEDTSTKPTSSPSAKQFSSLTQSSSRFLRLNSLVLENSYDVKLHTEARSWLKKHFSLFNLGLIRRPPFGQPYDGSRQYGISYIYSLDVAGEFLYGYVDADHDRNELVDLGLNTISRLNLNWSLADVQISLTRAWALLLQHGLPTLSKSKEISQTLSECIDYTLEICSQTLLPSRSSLDDEHSKDDIHDSAPAFVGDLAASIHHDRFTVLAPLTEGRCRKSNGGDTYEEAARCIQTFAIIARNDELGPLLSLRDRTRAPIHRPFFKALIFVLADMEVRAIPSGGANLSKEGYGLLRAMESILRIVTLCFREVLFVAAFPETADSNVESDLSLIVSLYRRILALTLKDPSHSLVAYWLIISRELDIFGQSFQIIVRMSVTDGRPVFAHHILGFCIALAAFPQSAEAMALEGVMSVLSNNILTPLASYGSLSSVSADSANRIQRERDPSHLVYCSMIALSTRLVEILGSSSLFMNQALSLARLYDAQMETAFGLRIDSRVRIHFGLFDEVHVTLGFYNAMLKKLHSSSGTFYEDIRKSFVSRSLVLLQQIVYFLSHPNHLISLLEAIGPRERMWLDMEMDTEMTDATAAIPDGADDRDGGFAERPVTACLTEELLKISGLIINTLHYALFAYDAYCKDVLDWPSDMTAIYPTSKITFSEPASIGTLWELSSVCLDILRQLQADSTKRNIGKPKQVNSNSNGTIDPPAPLQPFSVESTIQSATFTFESTLALAASQMAYWLYRGPPLLEREGKVQREISGDLSTDLLDLIKRAPTSSGSLRSSTRSMKGGEQGKTVSFSRSTTDKNAGGDTSSTFYTSLKVFVEEFFKGT